MKPEIDRYIKTWESRCYTEGIPDEPDESVEKLDRVPSYKSICKALLRNPYNLESLGISRVKSTVYSELKRIELGIEECQLKIGI